MLYSKTEAGRAEVQGRAHALSPLQRQVLILCDGERHVEDLREMVPAGSLQPAIDHLVGARLLALRDSVVKAKPVEVPLSESERYSAIVALATSMAADLGFAARVKAQLQIERAQSVQDLTGVVDLLCKHLESTPLMALRLNKLRKLAEG